MYWPAFGFTAWKCIFFRSSAKFLIVNQQFSFFKRYLRMSSDMFIREKKINFINLCSQFLPRYLDILRIFFFSKIWTPKDEITSAFGSALDAAWMRVAGRANSHSGRRGVWHERRRCGSAASDAESTRCTGPRTAFRGRGRAGKPRSEAEARVLDDCFLLIGSSAIFTFNLAFAEARLPTRGNGIYRTFVEYVLYSRGRIFKSYFLEIVHLGISISFSPQSL